MAGLAAATGSVVASRAHAQEKVPDDADRFVFEVVFRDDAHTGGAGPLTMVRSVYAGR